MIGVKYAMRVPPELKRRLKNDHATGDSRAKSLPSKFSAERKIRRLTAEKGNIGAIAIPLRPLRRADKPSPNPLRRRRNHNLIARINRRTLRLKPRRPLHRDIGSISYKNVGAGIAPSPLPSPHPPPPPQPLRRDPRRAKSWW